MRALIVACYAFFLASCHTTAENQSVHFFSLKHFFEQESIRLTEAKQRVDKSVSHNGSFERKNSFIQDWKNELNMFTESDINKPAWRDSYSVLEDRSSIRYHALDNNLRTRSIVIKKDTTGKPTQIDIINKTHNLLYQSREHLIYVPDSIYSIDKKQHVILIGDNHYVVNGKFLVDNGHVPY